MGPSTGALAWPWWSTCHLQCTPTPPMVPISPWHPLHPYAPMMPPIPCWPEYLHSASPPMHPWHPLHPMMAPDIYTPRSPWCNLYPCWPLSTYTPCQPPMHPWHPTPLTAPNPLWWPQYPYTPKSPLIHLHSCWLLSTYTSCQPQGTFDTPTSPDGLQCSLTAPQHPLGPPNAPWCHLYLLAPEHLHSLPAPMHPWHPLHPLMASQWPQMPLTAPTSPRIPQYPSWPLNTYTPCQPNTPLIPLHSLMDPHALWHPVHSQGAPQYPLMHPIPLLAPAGIHFLPAPLCTPCQPLDMP